jgi:hypothetical protein
MIVARCAPRKKRMLGGREEFLFKKSFGSKLLEIPKMQGVRMKSKLSRRPSSRGLALFRSVFEVREMES